MKTKIFILLLLLTGSALAQENSFIEPDVSSVKGFGAVVTKYSSLNNYDAFTIGGRGGWIFDNSIIIGGGIYGLASNVPVEVIDKNTLLPRRDKMHFMYGGVELEYVFNPKKIVHYSIYTLIGLGSISSHTNNQEYPNSYYDHNHMRNPFLVIEPSFNVTMNIAKFFEVAVGLGYMVTSGADYQTIDDKSLSGVNASITIKFRGPQ